MTADEIAAVIPVFNPEPGLGALAASLAELYSTVVVVDDGSRENVEDFGRLPEGVRIIRCKTAKAPQERRRSMRGF